MGRGVRVGLGVLFYIGDIKNFAFYKLGNFSKNVKKSMKNLQFWENFQIYIQKSQCKTDFYPFSHSSSRTFVILFFLGWVAWADVVPPELGGGLLSILERGYVRLYKPLLCFSLGGSSQLQQPEIEFLATDKFAITQTGSRLLNDLRLVERNWWNL